MKNVPVPPALIDFVNKYQRFFLVSHVDPDGDCLASSLALGKCLQELGKDVAHFNPGPFGRTEIKELEPYFSQRLPEDISTAAVIILDCSSPDRIADLADGIHSLPKAVIDHHSNGGDYGDIRFINSTAPSASLLIQQLIEALGIEMSPEMADLIFFAFATDTGFFRYLGEHSQETFQLLSRLSEAGASPKKTYTQISGLVSLDSRKHLGMLLQRAESHYNGSFLFTWATYNEINGLKLEDRDSAALYHQLMKVREAEILLLLWEKESGEITGNIRTNSRIDAGKLAAQYGGGGHARAAGFSSNKPIQTVFTMFKENLASFF